MTNHYRLDRIVQNIAPPAPGPGGAMLCEGVVARPGIYLYLNADGSTRRELIPREMLAEVRTDGTAGILTLGRAPLTLNHPPDMVTADNAAKYVVGDLDGEVMVSDNGYLRVKMAVRSKEALDAIAKGKVELSPGYLVSVDETPGEDPEFGPYDAKQTSRVYNHVAIVDAARGGAVCRIGLDGADEPVTTSEPIEVDEPGADATPTADDVDLPTPEGETAPASTADENPVTDDSMSTSTSTRTSKSETLPDGTVRYTSTETYSSETEIPPEDDTTEEELPEGWTSETVAIIAKVVRKALYGDAAPTKPAPAVVSTPVVQEVADDFMARYKTRRDLEDRADCTDMTKSDGDLARIALARWSVSTDGLTETEVIQKALALKAPSAIVLDAPQAPVLTVDKPADCYTRR